MTQPKWEQQVIRTAYNPRSAGNPVSFYVEHNDDADPPIRLRVRLPVGDDYFIPLTWQDWELMDAWLHSKLLETKSSNYQKGQQGSLGDSPYFNGCGTRGR